MKNIVMLFACLLALSCNENKKSYLLERISSNASGIDFINEIKEDQGHSIINYLYYYNGGGVAAGDINNDGLVDLYFVSNMGQNKLYLNKGNFKFEDISKKAKVQGASDWNTGVTMVDINNDGFLDIYVNAVSGLLDFKGHNELYINNGNETFTEKSKEYGLDFQGYATQAYFFDFDKDEDLDVYIVNHAVHTTLSHGPADVRKDRVPFIGDVLLQNENGNFKDFSEQANIYGGVNGYGLSASIGDFNNDGWDDIYVCNDFHEDDYYYINNHDGTFTDVLDSSFATISRFSMGSDAADVNNDGYLDLVTLDMLPSNEEVIKESEGEDAMFQMNKRLKKLGYKDQYSRNMLQINQQGAYFTETALFNGIESTDWSWGPLIADFNNDGHQDLFIANGILKRPNDLDFKKFVSDAFKGRSSSDGINWLYKSKDSMPSGAVSNEIFMGNSSKFQSKTGQWIEEIPTTSNGSIYADLDNDGDLDLIVNNLNEEAGVYQNTLNAERNYISLKFNYTSQNLSGLGTKVIVYTGKNKQFKQLYTSRGFLSAVDNKVHFGLDKQGIVDSIQIVWPNNTQQTVILPEINKTHTVSYSNGNRRYGYEPNIKEQFFTPEKNMISHYSPEDLYDDFLYEKLLPYKVSAIGPAVAVGDIDKNGYDDIFIGGSSGEKPTLYMNTGDGLIKSDIEEIAKDYLYEDNSAVFFDADNDNDLDLYVASGIHEVGINSLQKDRLYINEQGKFKRSIGLIPDNFLNTSVVAASDYDNDGDQDLFVGNLSKQGNFGASVSSYILINDGKGKFTIDDQFILTSHVTSAIWEDVNADGSLDLLISAEWDMPKVFLNDNGSLKLMNLPPNLEGLWQSIALFDVDEDGDKDILLGNWGLNTRLSATSEKPLKMYYSDFNSDGKFETVLAYNLGGNYYPINSKDELQSQMNFIRKKFPTYKKFALKTVEDIFGADVINNSRVYRATIMSSGYLENNNNNFERFISFPDPLQLGPINSFYEIKLMNENQLIISGNSTRVNNYNGAYLSLKGILMKSLNKYQQLSDFGVKPFDKEIRNIRALKQKGKNLLFVVPNNDSIAIYSY